jgi:nucleoside-diphosphate-sugar epimerase
MPQTVLILGGSGKIGSHSAKAFAKAGWTVRLYDRKADNMVAAAQGADVIVNGLNPAGYRDWETAIPAITAQVVAAAKASGATVIIPGNIYNYGNQPGILDENTPWLAHTRKGKIRVDMENTYRASGVKTIVLRAGNFIDPAGNGDIMSMLVMREITKGKVTAAADQDTMQTYAYVPDWARAAVALAEKREELQPFEDIPFACHAFTTAQLRDHLSTHLGRDIKISPFPWWLMTLLGPFWALVREMGEMRYLYAMPHRISGAKLSSLLPDFKETSQDIVMRAGLGTQVQPD